MPANPQPKPATAPPASNQAGPNFKVLSGVIERITFQSEETGYTVARLLPDRGRPEVNSSSSSSSSSSSKPDKSRTVAEASPRYHATRGEDNLVTVEYGRGSARGSPRTNRLVATTFPARLAI